MENKIGDNCIIMQKSAGQYSLRSQVFFMLAVPNARTEMGKGAFMCCAPLSWNMLQNYLKLKELIPLTVLKLTRLRN